MTGNKICAKKQEIKCVLIYPEHDASQLLCYCIFSLELDASLIFIAYPLIALVRIRYFVAVIVSFGPSILVDVLADLVIAQESVNVSELNTNRFLNIRRVNMLVHLCYLLFRPGQARTRLSSG